MADPKRDERTLTALMDSIEKWRGIAHGGGFRASMKVVLETVAVRWGEQVRHLVKRNETQAVDIETLARGLQKARQRVEELEKRLANHDYRGPILGTVAAQLQETLKLIVHAQNPMKPYTPGPAPGGITEVDGKWDPYATPLSGMDLLEGFAKAEAKTAPTNTLSLESLVTGTLGNLAEFPPLTPPVMLKVAASVKTAVRSWLRLQKFPNDTIGNHYVDSFIKRLD